MAGCYENILFRVNTTSRNSNFWVMDYYPIVFSALRIFSAYLSPHMKGCYLGDAASDSLSELNLSLYFT